MEIDLFSEMQHPRELWSNDGEHEHHLFEQIREVDDAQALDDEIRVTRTNTIEYEPLPVNMLFEPFDGPVAG